MPVWLVTGGSGFLGRHVLAALSGTRGIEVAALGRKRPPAPGLTAFVEADLERPESVAAAIRATRPTVVIHTAGRTPPCEPDELYRANTLGTLHVLDALKAERQACRVVLAGSAAELGPVEPSFLPVIEDHPCHPVDAYGLSKWLATCAGLAASDLHLEVVIARVFNPIGPGQPPSQALGRFAALLADRSTTVLNVGNLDTRRDFVDARDVARALIVLAERGRSGRVYHVGTGHSRRVGEALDSLIRQCGRAVEVRAKRDLPAGPTDSRADIRRIVAETGWRPRVAWEQSLEDLWVEAAARASGAVPLPLTA